MLRLGLVDKVELGLRFDYLVRLRFIVPNPAKLGFGLSFSRWRCYILKAPDLILI